MPGDGISVLCSGRPAAHLCCVELCELGLCVPPLQIQDISVETGDNKEKKSAKEALLLWCQKKTAG